MRFWDSSALVPLLTVEPASDQISDLLHEHPEVMAWWATRVECASALRRREREGFLAARDVQRAIELLGELADAWTEVLPTHHVRALAERALAVHSLRAADALQLAAAQASRRGQLEGAPFVCLDERLRDAAAREGFVPLPAERPDGA